MTAGQVGSKEELVQMKTKDETNESPLTQSGWRRRKDRKASSVSCLANKLSLVSVIS